MKKQLQKQICLLTTCKIPKESSVDWKYTSYKERLILSEENKERLMELIKWNIGSSKKPRPVGIHCHLCTKQINLADSHKSLSSTDFMNIFVPEVRLFQTEPLNLDKMKLKCY